jgi:hypothetical protein
MIHRPPSQPPTIPEYPETRILLGLGGFLLWVYAKIFLPYLPNQGGLMGHDWSIVLPAFLNGYYWILENGPFTIPWFTAAKCGGYAYFGIEGFYSLGSILTWFISPIQAIQSTFLIFVGLGYLGFYWLMRHVMKASIAASLLAAALFMFNGFSSHRMIVGHYPFHGFLLTPLIGWLLLIPSRQLWKSLAQLAAIGLSFAYMVHTPMLQILPATLLSITALLLLATLKEGWRRQPWLLFLGGGLLGIAIALSKLVAFTSLMSQFPRTYYPLPGVGGWASLLKSIFTAFFLPVPNDIGKVIVNSAFMIDRHEWEFGLSPVPLIVLPAGLLAWLMRHRARRLRDFRNGRKIAAALGVTLIATTPVAINWYEPHWNNFLKTIPFISSSSSLIRWLVMDVPILCALTGLALDQIGDLITVKRHCLLTQSLCGVSIAGIITSNIASDLSFYNQGYSSAPIEQAWHTAHDSKAPPPITQVAFQVVGNGPNDGLTIGVSSIFCYEPTMGYRLEKFPAAPLTQGPVFPGQGELLNLKNPACYTYPKENACKAGDHFKAGEKPAAEALIHYRPFDFVFSNRQKVANLISLFSFLLALGALVFALQRKLLCSLRAHEGPKPHS